MKILVIEDSIRLADTIAEALQNENYEVYTAHDGLTGYEHASTGIYDMIILDLMLPKMNGYEVLSSLPEQLRCRLYSVPTGSHYCWQQRFRRLQRNRSHKQLPCSNLRK